MAATEDLTYGSYLAQDELLALQRPDFARWRFLHVQLAERIVGPSAAGTGRMLGTRYLQRTAGQRFFPNLWEVRTRLYAGPKCGARTEPWLERMSLRLRKLARTPLLATGRHAPYVT